MSLSFKIPSKSQSNRPKKPSASFAALADDPPTSAAAASSAKNYVSEFKAAESQPIKESQFKPIAPIPNQWRPNIKLKNLQNLPSITQPNDSDSSLQFELDPGSNNEPSDGSITYGLNIREPSSVVSGASTPSHTETIAEFELRKLREDLDKLPEDTGMDQFEDVPVEGFGAALLSGYGWKEGRGIGRNAKEDVQITEVTKKAGRGGLGFDGDLPEDKAVTNGDAAENTGSMKVGRKKTDDRNFRVGKEVRIVHGRDMGMKGKIVELRSGGDVLVLRMSRTDNKVKIRSRDVAEVGSAEEEKFLRKLKEMKMKEKDVVIKDRRDRNPSSKMNEGKERAKSERVAWLRNHIRVRIVSKELKGGRLFLKKGTVVDVVGPGVCDISMDGSRELIQGVDQELLETALPKRGGPVLVLYGKHKGVYGNLVERDTEMEMGIVRDGDTHELLNVKLEEIAEFIGDPSDFGY